MSCPFERDVLLLADGDLPFGRRMVVEAHLSVCPSCAAIEETLDVVEHQLRNGPASPLGVVEPALARIVAPAPGRPLLWGGLVAAAAAALLVVMFWQSPEPPRAEPTVVDVRTPEPPGVTLPLPSDPELADRVARLEPDDVEAAEELAVHVRRQGAAGTSALARLLGDADPDVVARALAVAERAPSPRLARRLVALLDEPVFAARAARLLGIAGDDRVVPALAARLTGEAGVEAREAIVAIGGRAATQAIVAQYEATPGPDLLDALARLDPSLAAREVVLTRDAFSRDVLVRRASTLVPELRRLCRDEAYAPRAARALGWARDPAAIPLLAELASSRRFAAREAAGALLAYETPAATRRALRAYRLGGSPDAVAVAFAGSEAAERDLLVVVRDGPSAERVAALELLTRCGGPRTIDALRPMRLHGAALTAAIEAVGAIGGPQSVPTLAAWRNRGRTSRRALIAALGATRQPGAVELLVDYGASAEVCAALGRIHTAASAGRLIDILLKRRFTREAGEALRGMPVRVVVPELLARFETPGASRPLRVVLRQIAGTDLGSRVESWQSWWDSRP